MPGPSRASGRSDMETLRSIQNKSIEEVMIARKASHVLALNKTGPNDASFGSVSRVYPDGTFLAQEPPKRPSQAQVVADFRSHLDATMGDGQDLAMQEAYNTMRERCLMLTERLMQLEKVAHTVQMQRDELLNRKEKSVELSTCVHDVTVGLDYLNQIFQERDQDVQSDAATIINSQIRGFLIRRRATKARISMQRWQQAQLQQLEGAVRRFLAAKRVSLHNAYEFRMRRERRKLCEIVLAWRMFTRQKLPERKKYLAKHDIIRAKHLTLITATFFGAWHGEATGRLSGKNNRKSYQQRRRKAELALLTQQGETGVPDEITDPLIEAEVTRQAVEHISEQHFAKALGTRLLDWKDSGPIRAAKTHYNQRLQRDALVAWHDALVVEKSSDERWAVDHQTRVKMRVFFRALQEDTFGAWAYFGRTRGGATRRFRALQMKWLKQVFDQFRTAAMADHEVREATLHRLQAYVRGQRSVPFQAWHTYAIQQQVWHFAVEMYIAHGARRRMLQLVKSVFSEWAIVCFAGSADDNTQLIGSVNTLQKTNEELRNENMKAMAQAEQAVKMSEAQLNEKEHRAQVAEKAAQKLQLELQRAKEELLKMKQQKEAQDVLLEARNQIAGTKKTAPEPAPVEPTKPKEGSGGLRTEVTQEELLLLNRAKWAIDQFSEPPAYAPPPTDGTPADMELGRLNAIVEVLCDAKRQPVKVPPNTRLPPVKPPSREALVETGSELQWDEFLTGLDEFDQNRRNSMSSSAGGTGSRPSTRESLRPGSHGGL